MGYQDIVLEREGEIAIIALNRPEKANAVSARMSEELVQALIEVKEDDGLRVLILTGRGNSFCSGGDVSRLDSGRSSEEASKDMAQGAIRRVNGFLDLGKPTIAAVNGAAAGSGLALAAWCDMRLATITSKFGSLYVKRGLMPDSGLTYALTRIVGPAKACWIMFTGDYVSAPDAERMGLVDRIVPDGELMTSAKELAGRIARNAPIALKYTKQAVYRALDQDLQTLLDFEAEHQSVLYRTEDLKEGMRSFLEKREPKFSGK